MSMALVRASCGACGAELPTGAGPRIRCARCGSSYDLHLVASASGGPMRSVEAHELTPTAPPPPHRRIFDRSHGETIRHVQIQGLSSIAHGSSGWILAGIAFVLLPLMLSAAAGSMSWGVVWVTAIVLAIPAVIIMAIRSGGGAEELRIEAGMVTHSIGSRRRTLGVSDVVDVRRAPRSVIIIGRSGATLTVGESASLDYSALDWLHRHINEGLAVARERPMLEAPR
jgi:hypothetical protein